MNILTILSLALASLNTLPAASVPDPALGDDLDQLETLLVNLGSEDRVKREAGVTILDIRDALLQMLKVMRDNNKKSVQDNKEIKQQVNEVAKGLKSMGRGGGVEKKIDNISTFLLRMNNKIEALSRGSGGGRTAILETLAQESYDIISLLPTYIDNTRKAVYNVGNDTGTKLREVEAMLSDEDDVGGKMSLRKTIQATEEHILSSSNELKDIIVESGSMAESLFDRVASGYKDLEDEISGLANVEKVLLDTADAVMDTKRKIEFGVQQIIFKVSELIELSGGEMDDNLAAKFETITRTILSNQTDALNTLTTKVEKDIGQVWRQMGIMYGQLSNSINILEKVKTSTEEFSSKSNKNLGSMDNQVEGLTNRMTEVDENLNYMLGQLSLVVTEFNQVKTGLGEAMENIGDDLLEEYKKSGDTEE